MYIINHVQAYQSPKIGYHNIQISLGIVDELEDIDFIITDWHWHWQSSIHFDSQIMVTRKLSRCSSVDFNSQKQEDIRCDDFKQQT